MRYHFGRYSPRTLLQILESQLDLTPAARNFIFETGFRRFGAELFPNSAGSVENLVAVVRRFTAVNRCADKVVGSAVPYALLAKVRL